MKNTNFINSMYKICGKLNLIQYQDVYYKQEICIVILTVIVKIIKDFE